MNSNTPDYLVLVEKLRLAEEENRRLTSELTALREKTELTQSDTGYNLETIIRELDLIHQVMNFGNFTWWKMELPSGRVKFGHKKTDMLGYNAANFNYYEDFTRLLHPDDYKQTMQAMHDHLNGHKEFYQAEYRIKDINGEYLWFEDLGKVVEKDTQNRKVSLIGYVMDISARKQAESTLYNQRIEIENYLNIIPDLLARCTSNGILNLRNKAWVEHLGYPVSEEINLFSIIHPEEEEKLRSHFDDLQPEHSIKGIINRIYKKSISINEEFWVVPNI